MNMTSVDLSERQAIILAGGMGTRLSEETTVRPKPMVEIGGRPILWHIMKIYSRFGVNKFIVALGYKGEVIKQYFLNYCALQSDIEIHIPTGEVTLTHRPEEQWTVKLVDTGLHTQTGGRLRRLKQYVCDDPFFFLTYGDGVADIDIHEQVRGYLSSGHPCMLTAVRPPSRFGALELDGQEVRTFNEKPQTGEGWINGGFFIFSNRVFDLLADDSTILERTPLEKLASNRELGVYPHYGFWHPMDTLRDVRLLNELWDKGEAPWKKW